MLQIKNFYLTTFLSVLLTGCNGHMQAPKPEIVPKNAPRALTRLQTLSAPTKSKTRVNPLRATALRDTALSLGARGGLAYRALEINSFLINYEPLINRVFNFTHLMLDNNVLPPVLIEGRNTLNVGSESALRIADRNYQILSQARFVTAAPTWREYLWLSYGQPEQPDKSLLPKNTEEKVIWKYYVQEGWQAGLQQADIIYRENLGRLKRDMEGMIRYRSLLAQNMVSPPYVAKLEMGITGNANDMTINDRVLRITAFPSLKLDSGQWKTEIVPHE
ncbi:MAG: dotC [Francisellaceae bacterium]|nr:dotC [Francisellaceae bacterium]